MGLLYMAGINPTSCVPLPLFPFMWLQEEKALTEKKTFVFCGMSCLAICRTEFMNRLTCTLNAAGTVLSSVGGSVVMEPVLDLSSHFYLDSMKCSR